MLRWNPGSFSFRECQSDAGIEGLPYGAFDDAIRRTFALARDSGTSIACLQTNQACRPRFEADLTGVGWHEVEAIEGATRPSHTDRGLGRHRREHETMLVFEREH